MKNYKILSAGILISFFFFTNTSFAQPDESSLELPVFGIGLHAEQYKISDALDNFYSAYTSTVLLPINLTQHFRLEPELGLLWMNDKDNDYNTLGFSGGLGVFGMFQREKLNIYIGGRFMFDRARIEGSYIINNESATEKYTAIKIGPAFGFEYFLSKNFSIGGEIGLRYSISKSVVEYPESLIDPPYIENEETKSEMFNFDSGLFVRIYF